MQPEEAPFDMERIVPELLSRDDPVERSILETHLERYEFAGRFVSGARVLDLACGVGYGSALLRARGAAEVVGVDVAQDAVALARQRTGTDGVTFLCEDGFRYAPDRPFDVVVSFETVEHVGDAHGLLARLASFVRPGGLLIASVPTTLSTDVNPYHVHDFSERGFRDAFTGIGLRVEQEFRQRQPYSPLGILRARKTSRRDYTFRPNLVRWYAAHPLMALRRLGCTLRHGFANKYLILVARKP